ncbi:MAG: methylenetetrahydrofolate reductase [Candidatus Ranarchaeia archaeon]|jgi:methylenetetrahydrofolate reductase (NADPH)
MSILEYIETHDTPFVSFEITPPKRTKTAQPMLTLVDRLAAFKPAFIDVTSHASEVSYEEIDGKIKRKVERKRPGTIGICAVIQHKYQVEAVPHVLCRGFTKEETEDFLIDLKYLGIRNIFAAQGDTRAYKKPVDPSRSVNTYACDLVEQVNAFKKGKLLDKEIKDVEAVDFCIGVAGYPEKHFEAPNMMTDLRNTKAKVDAGADYIVTQMFFDNRHFFGYEELCRKNGISVPIIPGLKILTKKSQLAQIPRNFFTEIPYTLSESMKKAKKEDLLQIGIEHTLKQIEELVSHGVPGIHIFVKEELPAIEQFMKELTNRAIIS